MKKLTKKFTHSCSLDCYDLCKFDVYRKGKRVTKILGSTDNAFTKGIICSKGRKHVDRLYSRDRIKTPLLKVDGQWREITFEEAIRIVGEKLSSLKAAHGSQSVVHYAESGAGGVLKGIEDIFFNFYGGITTTTGSTCWGAGSQAQKYDFGDRRSSDIDDIFNGKTIVLWGRNPYNTSIHLYERVLQAKKKGIRVVIIDPRVNESARAADLHISPNPSTDGALAMAVTKHLIEERGIDTSYIEDHIQGYEEYREYLEGLSMEYLLEETGVSREEVETLTGIVAQGGVSCFLGYGMQKYTNGGNSIRAIDALMAISKNIGRRGAGVFYSNRVYPSLLDTDPYGSEAYAVDARTFKVTEFVDYINRMTEADKDPIKAIFISKCNPLNQYPNLNESIAAFERIEFKVCIDGFMTDTAKHCDLVIPSTNTLESEDIIYSSMHSPYLLYNERIVEPEDDLMDEYFFFQKLAMEMGMDEYPQVDKRTYIGRILEPVGLTIEDLRSKSINLSRGEVAWEDMAFPTPSGKVEIYSEIAKGDGQSPIPVYIPSLKKSEEFPLRLISPHFKNSLFSQHFREKEGLSRLYVGKENMRSHTEGERVTLTSKYGRIECTIHLDETLREDMVYMYAGWNHKHGNPNFLTYNGSSEMGGQVTYYDTFIKIG